MRDTPFRFAVWGDSQQHSDTFGRIVQGIAEWRPDIALSVGDVVDNGWDLSAWETQFFGPIQDLAMTTPLFQAIGNHEGLSPLFDIPCPARKRALVRRALRQQHLCRP